VKRYETALLELRSPDYEPIRRQVVETKGQSFGDPQTGREEQSKQAAVGVRAQRSAGTEARRFLDQPLGVLFGVDKWNTTASFAAKHVCRRDFMLALLSPNMAGKANHRAQTVMALARRRSLTGPFDDRGRPNVSFAAPGSESGVAAQEAPWNFQLESGRPPKVEVPVDGLHQHDNTSGHG
jgi:hypothetical protein